MSQENFLWGAPRNHGELLKLEYDVSQATVFGYMPRRGYPPTQTWRALLRNQERGRAAETRSQIPATGCKDIFWRIYQNVSQHRILAIAAGVTFYASSAIFPGIAALVALYGPVANPSTIGKHLTDLSGVLPGGAMDVIGDQLQRLRRRGHAKLGGGERITKTTSETGSC
jgi:membrane protein